MMGSTLFIRDLELRHQSGLHLLQMRRPVFVRIHAGGDRHGHALQRIIGAGLGQR